MEDEVIADIARRVKKTGRYTETAELMAKSMVEQGYSAEKIQAEVMKNLRADKAYQMAVAENTKAYKQEIQDIIDKTVAEAKEAGDALIAEAGNMAWNNDLSMWSEQGVDLKKPNTMSQMINAFQSQTAGQLKNLTKTMGFKNTTLGTTGILNAYQREMDLALLKVSTGAFSYDQAVNDCIKRLAQSGLRSIDYASGRTYQLDTAARMCVRTGMSQLAGKVMEENLKSTGQDLVITSQHMGSRPEHAPWQNKVFSYSGKNKKYPDFFKETGYGTVAGLKGANCTHDFYPFWEGASVIPEDIKEPPPIKVNGKEYTYYQATQQQRKMERDIRATKREIEAQKAIGGDTTELQSKLRGQTAAYKNFSADAGLKVKQNRLRVVGGSSSSNKKIHKSSESTRPDVQKTNKQKVPLLSHEVAEIDYRAEKVTFKDLLSWKKAIGNVTDEEYAIISGMSETGYIRTSNSYKINKAMREDTVTNLSEGNQKTIATLKEVISKNISDRDAVLIRKVDFEYLKGTYGIDSQDLQDIVKKLNDKVGTVHKEKGFVSTSYKLEKNLNANDKIELDISAPKGTEMFLTKNREESEIILQAGTRFELEGAVLTDDGKVRLLMKVMTET